MVNPARAICSVDAAVMSAPPNRTVPDDAGSNPGDGLEQARLSRSVGAEQGHHFASFDFQINAEEHLHGPIGRIDLVAAEQHVVVGI